MNAHKDFKLFDSRVSLFLIEFLNKGEITNEKNKK